MGKAALGRALIGIVVAAALAFVARRCERPDALLVDEPDRQRAEAAARYFNEVGDSAGF